MVLNIASSRAKRFRAGKIADNRNDQILPLQVSNDLEILFVRKIAPGLPLLIRSRHQIRICAAKSAVIRRGIPVYAGRIKENPIDEIDGLQVTGVELKPVSLDQAVLYGL